MLKGFFAKGENPEDYTLPDDEIVTVGRIPTELEKILGLFGESDGMCYQ